MPLDDAFDITHDKDWLSPLSVPVLAEAVKDRMPFVILAGKRFNIKYDEDEERAFVRIDGNYAPCGWFTFAQLEQYEFESDHDKHL
jgi:hypothetical protein